MIIRLTQKVKEWIGENKSDLYIALIIFLVGLSGFGLGRLSVLWPEKEAVKVTNQGDEITGRANDALKAVENISSPPDAKTPSANSRSKFVASKNGTAYHYPWCPGALKIKEENKIWFQTKEEAEKRGYRPAGNCEGL